MLNLNNIDPSWQPILSKALTKLPPGYLSELKESPHLPENHQVFAAFQLPLTKVHYILFGESPYPRFESANGFAFWDNAVTDIWSATGLAKKVNRATSLRNLIKMLLVTHNLLAEENLTQDNIATIDKTLFVKTLNDLFANFLHHGFLLLNATPILRKDKKNYDAKCWQPFLNEVLLELSKERPEIKLILLGKIAEAIQKLPSTQSFDTFIAEHPYNISFITNKNVQQFFKPFNLLYQQP